MLLTHLECVEILKNFLKIENKQIKLENFYLARDNSAKGYLGDYYALTLDYSTEANQIAQQQEFFVKALPTLSDEPTKEAIFCKEAYLYKTLLADLQKYSTIKWSANCYYTRVDLCVFENIKLLGYSCASSTLLHEQQLQQLLRTLAGFHAASLAYEERSGCNIGQHFADHLQEITVAANIAWFTTGLSAIVAVIRTLPQYQTTKYINFIETKLSEILGKVCDLVAPSSKYRNVLCHRDLWAGNILFTTQSKQSAILVDFQTSRYSPPALDLCVSLYLNLSYDVRKRLESKFIDEYYSWFRQDLKDLGLNVDELLTKAELLQSYEETRLFGVVYGAVVDTIIKVPTALVSNEYKYVDRSESLLNYMSQNSKIRADIEQRCTEVMEIAVKYM